MHDPAAPGAEPKTTATLDLQAVPPSNSDRAVVTCAHRIAPSSVAREILPKLMANIVRAPGEAKYRTIKLTNPKIAQARLTASFPPIRGGTSLCYAGDCRSPCIPTPPGSRVRKRGRYPRPSCGDMLRHCNRMWHAAARHLPPAATINFVATARTLMFVAHTFYQVEEEEAARQLSLVEEALEVLTKTLTLPINDGPVIVIGAGAAGIGAARRAREAGATVVVRRCCRYCRPRCARSPGPMCRYSRQGIGLVAGSALNGRPVAGLRMRWERTTSMVWRATRCATWPGMPVAGW